jgi:hypothetical protein
MGTFFMMVAGVVVGLLIVLALAWWWIKRRLSKLGDALGSIGNAVVGTVPPFRISLEPLEDSSAWRSDDAVQQRSSELEKLGYHRSGDFSIAEMDGVVIRGFCHPTAACMAALYQHPQVDELLIDINRAHFDHSIVLVTNAAETGMDDPPNKKTIRYTDGPAMAEMHNGLLAACEGHEAFRISAGLFRMMFTTAYAAEMDWRIERDGVTADEVRAAAAAGGQEAPDDDVVDLVQLQWRATIETFMDDEVLSAFQASKAIAENQQGRVRPVHAKSNVDELSSAIAAAVFASEQPDEDELDDDEYEEAVERLEAQSAELVPQIRACFAGGSTADEMRNAMAKLPSDNVIAHLGETQRPYPAQFYLFPEER